MLEDVAQAGAQGDPDVAQRLGVAGVVEVLGLLAADAGERALGGADDVGDADLGGRLRRASSRPRGRAGC